jgi:hypothetical protein
MRKINKYSVTLSSLTPYMQHRMDDMSLAEWEKSRGQIIERKEVSQSDAYRAEYHCYRNDAGNCYIPADQLRCCLIQAGTYVKSKVGALSKSMKTIVAACFIITPEQIILPDYDAIDKRSAVNKNVKARVMVVRPKWSKWEAVFTLEVHEPTITIETIIKLFEYAGNFVGFGSYRPTNSGMYGRFELIDIKELSA